MIRHTEKVEIPEFHYDVRWKGKTYKVETKKVHVYHENINGYLELSLGCKLLMKSMFSVGVCHRGQAFYRKHRAFLEHLHRNLPKQKIDLRGIEHLDHFFSSVFYTYYCLMRDVVSDPRKSF